MVMNLHTLHRNEKRYPNAWVSICFHLRALPLIHNYHFTASGSIPIDT